MRTDQGQFVRFLIAGAINTGITYGLYLALLQSFSYGIAYSIAYVCGIALSYVLNARFVFHEPFRLSGLVRFPLVYVVQYALASVGLWVMVELAGVREHFALAIVIVLTVPVVFAVARAIIRRG